jgi:hypothetical protein
MLGDRLRSAAGQGPAPICTPTMLKVCGRNGFCFACRREPEHSAAGLHCAGCMAHLLHPKGER